MFLVALLSSLIVFVFRGINFNYYYYHYLLFWEFFPPALTDRFSQESGWQQVTSNFLDSSQYFGRSQQCCSWMVSTSPLFSKSSSPCIDTLVIVPRASITISIAVTFMFHRFFNSLFFWLIITRSSCLTEIRWSVCIRKLQRSWCVSFSRTDSGLYIYHFFIWKKI